MRWPFVSRAWLDAAERLNQLREEDARRDYNQIVEDYSEMAESWATRYDALLDKYHALKVIGAVVPEPKPQLSPAKPQGPIAEAIDEVCSRYANSVKLRRRLMKYAEDMKRSDGEDAEIAHAILHWRSPDDDEAVA